MKFITLGLVELATFQVCEKFVYERGKKGQLLGKKTAVASP